MSANVVRLLLAVALACTSSFAAPSPSSTEARKTSADTRQIDVLRNRLLQLTRSFPGKIGLHVRHLETETEVAIDADEMFPLASVYKIPMMVQVFRDADAGRLSLNERVMLKDEDKRLGSGLFKYFSPGLNPTVHDLVLLMITVSDNEATDLLLSRVGAQNVTNTMHELGLRNVRVDRSTKNVVADWLGLADPAFRQRALVPVPRDEDAFDGIPPAQMERANRSFTGDERDHGSPRAINDLLTKIFRSEAASEKSCHDMLEIMKHQQLTEGIPRYLNDCAVANKTGQIGYTTNDAAIIYAEKQHIALTVFTLRANEAVSAEEAYERIARIARTVVDYFQDTAPVQ